MLILIGLAFLGHLGVWILEPLPAIGMFAATFVLATIASLPAVLVLRILDRRERESIWLFVGAILWGAVISTGVSGVFNFLGLGFITVGLDILAGVKSDMLPDILTAALVAPVVEEAAKGIGLLILLFFLHAELDNVRDGIIYGGLVGLGFNIAEVALYVMKGYIDSGVAPFGEQFAARFVFLGFNGHLLWAALCGAGVGLARQTRNGCLRWAAPVAGYLVAVLGHALNNSVGVFMIGLALIAMGYDLAANPAVPAFAMWVAAVIMNVLVAGFAYLLLLTFLFLSAQWERAVIRTYLSDEVGTPVVTPQEYVEIARDRPFTWTQRLRNTGGRQARKIINAQNELAFRKWHLDREGGDPNADPLVAAWRADIEQLRQA
jgi:RsiW-degrading membrane proteinase PrsW (M82 family)